MSHFSKIKVLHPFLFAAFPVFFLYAENTGNVEANTVWKPLALILGGTALVFIANRFLFRNPYKAGLFSSAIVLLFFLYYPLFHTLEQYLPGMARQRFLAPVVLAALVGLGWYLFRSKNGLTKLTKVLNLTAFVLLLPSLLKVGWHAAQPAFKVTETETPKTTATARPDIYYFIMDAYGRQDVLKNIFNLDNGPFLAALKKRGFYVADKSTSNYYFTNHSVPSALNLNYLPEVISPPNLKKPASISVKKLVQHSRFRKILTEQGYKYVAYASGVDFTEVRDADFYFGHNLNLTELEVALLNTTPIPNIFHSLFAKDVFSLHRATVLYPFEHLEESIGVPGPKFVQIHVLCPHIPFVFDENGNETTGNILFEIYQNIPIPGTTATTRDENYVQEYKTGYASQVKFMNKKLLEAIDAIQAISQTPPVIIIQGDHGPRLNSDLDKVEKSNHFETFANLSAFYFPNQDTAGLYPEISPVNIFRLVSNKYFNAQMPLLPDRSYYSSADKNYEFIDVTDKAKPQKQKPLTKY